jgi:mutator protein MutT
MSGIVCSLVFLLEDDRVLLAMKKRGFGKDRWNGVGGKLDTGETIEQTAVRECQEEIGVTPHDLEKMAIITFTFPDDQPDMIAHIYTSRRWTSKPIETEEMAPRWFNTDRIPYNDMWGDDIFWLPAVLLGKKLQASFDFNDNQQATAATIQLVEAF